MDASRRPSGADSTVPPVAQFRAGSLAWFVSVWGVGGVALSLGMAIFRLGKRALLLRERGLAPFEWAVLVVCALAFAYGEGYRALHLRFSPRVIARVAALTPASGAGVGVGRALLAPVYALGLIQRDRAGALRAWLAVALIGLAVAIVRALPDPWRAIIDASVVLALSIGLVSLVVRFAAWLRSQP